MDSIERGIIYSALEDNMPVLWLGAIHDIVALWTDSIEKLPMFLERMNSAHPMI